MSKIEKIQELISWSHKNYSHLPWREKRSLYNTLVSEIMLQQTTVSTVMNHFDRFIEKYPTVEDLARVEEEQILIDWKGLGYYRRARNLLRAAKEIVEKLGGEIPLDTEKLKSIHGIGDYTASALLAIGADKKALAVDANLERVIARVYGIESEKGPKLQKAISQKFSAGEVCSEIEIIGARDFNEALMDLGRSICKARSASCEICPMQRDCVAAKGDPLRFPREKELKEKKKVGGIELELLRIVVEKEGKVLAYKKNTSEWLSGQYEIPTFTLRSEDESFSQYPMISVDKEQFYFLRSFRTGITKYKIDNYILDANQGDIKKMNLRVTDYEWVDFAKLSTASQKALSN